MNWTHRSVVKLELGFPGGLKIKHEFVRKVFSCNKFQSNMFSVKWRPFCLGLYVLTHWGRVTHICVSNLTTIGSDNGLSPGRGQAIFWTNAGILSIGPLGTNFSEILIEIHAFSFKKRHFKLSSGKWQPFCLGLNVLKWVYHGICMLKHLFINSNLHDWSQQSSQKTFPATSPVGLVTDQAH